MNSSVTLPAWVFLILAFFAGWAVLVLLLTPSMRWFLRRRANVLIGELNTRLPVELPSFKLTRRQVLIDRLFHDPVVQAAASAHARDTGASLRDTWRRVDRYAREIVPSFNVYIYFRIGYALARAVARALYRVRIGYADEQALARVTPQSTIVFVINHRSNMDYVLAAFLAAERTALSYAVGEWARIWPLQQLIRSMGAYFVRRSSGNPLYRVVLARYVHLATTAGVTQAVFPEGGLTVDGRLRAPKFGLFDYMLKGFDVSGERDLVFIPVGINYDRVLEDRTQLRKLRPEAPHQSRMRGLAIGSGFFFRNLWLILSGRWHRLGYACVNFGTPLSMREYSREHALDFPALDEAARRAAVATLAARIMDDIGRIIPVLPVALVADIMARDPTRVLSELELKGAAHARMQELEACGAHLYIPRQDQDYAFVVGLRMLIMRRIVLEEDGVFRASPDQLDALRYYANSIVHLQEGRPEE